MFINKKYKFVFIKTKKTAGSSIEKFLFDISDKNDIICTDQPYENLPSVNLHQKHKDRHRGHSSWRWIQKNYIKKDWDDYFKFTVERNSWDKVVSTYHWQKVTEPQHNITSFERYIKKQNRLYNKKDWDLYTQNNVPVVDYIIDYDNLNNDLAQICQILSIAYNNEIQNINLKTGYRKNKDYRQYYDEETKKIVADTFSKEIEYFNFKF